MCIFMHKSIHGLSEKKRHSKKAKKEMDINTQTHISFQHYF